MDVRPGSIHGVPLCLGNVPLKQKVQTVPRDTGLMAQCLVRLTADDVRHAILGHADVPGAITAVRACLDQKGKMESIGSGGRLSSPQGPSASQWPIEGSWPVWPHTAQVTSSQSTIIDGLPGRRFDVNRGINLGMGVQLLGQPIPAEEINDLIPRRRRRLL